MSITELILQAKTWGKSNPGVLFFLKALCSIACLRSILKGYQPDSFSYGFHMLWTVFRHSFRLLFWKMSEKDHITSLYGWVPAAFCMCNSLEQTFSLSLLLKKLQSRLKYYWLYTVKTTWGLIIKNVWHVSTNFTDTIWNLRLLRRDRSSLWISEHNAPTKWRYFGYKNNLYGTKGTFIVTGSLVSANTRRSSKICDSFYCFSDLRDQSTVMTLALG